MPLGEKLENLWNYPLMVSFMDLSRLNIEMKSISPVELVSNAAVTFDSFQMF